MKLLTNASSEKREPEKRRVLVPTMGALHQGHLELFRAARENAGAAGEVFVSIFVNALQFEPGADFETYPRPKAHDEQLCREAGVDLLFRPSHTEMYGSDFSVQVEETTLSKTLCGASRPGHFRGVCTVVTKLFHILSPDAAIFGEKDFQQLAIIRRLVRDLNFGVEIIGVPTVRESDGLACSSRNQHLNTEQRTQAPLLRASLLAASEVVRDGERSAARVMEASRTVLAKATLARIDYVELVNAETLQRLETFQPNSLLALAVFFGKTRLIDNILLP